METHRLVSTAATILGLTISAAHGQVLLQLGINKRHVQTGANVIRFDHGELDLSLSDGSILLAACSSDPQLFFYGPHLGCALGITGFISSGDFNRDGVRDDNQYWSIDSITPALLIEPARPDLCSLVSAPPSKLPRPLRIFQDGSVIAFHDLRTPQVTQYNLSFYQMIRRYGSVRQVETAVAAGAVETTGTIDVVVTSVDLPGGSKTVPVTVTVTSSDGEDLPVFAEQWAENVRVALSSDPDITAFYSVSGSGSAIELTEIVPNGNDATLNIALTPGSTTTPSLPIPTSVNTLAGVLAKAPATALKQMNEELVNGRYVFSFPRLDNPNGIPVYMPVTIVPNVEALGSNPRTKAGFRLTSGVWKDGAYQMDPRLINTLTWTGNDSTVVVPGDQIFFSILSPSEDRITFPPTIPEAPVLLPSPVVQSYTLPPAFYDVGEEGVIDVRYQRTLPINNVSFDRSRRQFRGRVQFVDSYPGYGQGIFPLGSAGDTTPDGDFDRDGMSNIEEFAFQFPTNEDITASAREQFVPAPVPPDPNFPGVIMVEEFRRVIEKEDEPIIDDTLAPAGPVGPALEPDNRVAFRVPFRPRTGASLRYDFFELTTNNKGKVKSKRIKPGAKWAVTLEDVAVPVTRNVHIEVSILDAVTRETLFIRTRPATVTVSVTQQELVLRSVNPVNPADPLPTVDVKVTPISLK